MIKTNVLGINHFTWIDRAEYQGRDLFPLYEKLVEKYDVSTTGTGGGGGEYPLQDGFGWTNGVTLKMLDLICPKSNRVTMFRRRVRPLSQQRRNPQPKRHNPHLNQRLLRQRHSASPDGVVGR